MKRAMTVQQIRERAQEPMVKVYVWAPVAGGDWFEVVIKDFLETLAPYADDKVLDARYDAPRQDKPPELYVG